MPNRRCRRFCRRICSGEGIIAPSAVAYRDGFCHCAASQSTSSKSIAKAAGQSDDSAAHRANGNKIGGTVITLVDIKARKDSYAGKTPRGPK